MKKKIIDWLEYRLWLLFFLLLIPFLMIYGSVIIIPRFFRYVEDTVKGKEVRLYKY